MVTLLPVDLHIPMNTGKKHEIISVMKIQFQIVGISYHDVRSRPFINIFCLKLESIGIIGETTQYNKYCDDQVKIKIELIFHDFSYVDNKEARSIN